MQILQSQDSEERILEVRILQVRIYRQTYNTYRIKEDLILMVAPILRTQI